MKKNNYIIIISAVIFIFFGMYVAPQSVHATTAATPKITPVPVFEISGWIPYWRKATGTIHAIAHINIFKEINPFAYTVKQDGTLFDALKVNEEPWPSLRTAARANKVRIIPTIMWSNGAAIHAILKNPKTRKTHINAIVAMVKNNDFDGVDIDYEGKKAETKKYFSYFLHDLYEAMGKKWVNCTIEARTPLDSRFDTIPKDIQFANDFVAINNYCDRVRIMTYDQGAVDLKLNKIELGPYVPVADTRWVEKVIRLAAKTIVKKKIVIGVATYGYEYSAVPTSKGYWYDRLWAFNPKYATDLAMQLAITPQRNSAGEKSFIYMATSSSASGNMVINTPSINNTEAAAILSQTTATITSTTTPFRILWWSDAQAIKDKIDLARKLGVRGVAVFKIDGGEDPALWNILH